MGPLSLVSHVFPSRETSSRVSVHSTPPLSCSPVFLRVIFHHPFIRFLHSRRLLRLILPPDNVHLIFLLRDFGRCSHSEVRWSNHKSVSRTTFGMCDNWRYAEPSYTEFTVFVVWLVRNEMVVSFFDSQSNEDLKIQRVISATYRIQSTFIGRLFSRLMLMASYQIFYENFGMFWMAGFLSPSWLPVSTSGNFYNLCRSIDHENVN